MGRLEAESWPVPTYQYRKCPDADSPESMSLSIISMTKKVRCKQYRKPSRPASMMNIDDQECQLWSGFEVTDDIGELCVGRASQAIVFR
jgi:hypothetical protein